MLSSKKRAFLTINAGSGDDTLIVDTPYVAPNSIVFNTIGGNNTAYIKRTLSGTITYNGGDGTDVVDIGNASNTLDQIGSGAIYVDGREGQLTLIVRDQGSSGTSLIDYDEEEEPYIHRTKSGQATCSSITRTLTQS